MQALKQKHLLVDTNLLITISQHSKAGFFDCFLSNLKSLEVKSVVEASTLFEFRRGSKKPSQLQGKNTFLELLLGNEKDRWNLPISKEILELAEHLAILYSHKNSNLSKQVSFVDCLIAAQLMKYKENLFLATIDHGDYPLFIFDRLEIITIDAGIEIINIGIYSFNQKKYMKCKSDFERVA